MNSSNKVRPGGSRANPFNNKEKSYLLTDPVFLIGNGVSRKDFDLERLRGKGTIVGCNALYRDFSPDILVSIDAKMLKELYDDGYCNEHECMMPSNRTVKVPKAMTWKVERFNTSGCFAMKMISQLMEPKYCFMLGMDCYPGNIYDGSQNYAAHTLKNFNGVGKYYIDALRGPGSTIFVNVNTVDSWPVEAHETKKYQAMRYEEFEKFIKLI